MERSDIPLQAPPGSTREPAAAVASSSVPYEPWGIDDFDRRYGGLVAGAFNMLAAPDHDAAIAAIGHFLARGLGDERRTVLVAFDNPRLILAKFALYGFDYTAALESERLVYLYYKPTFSHALSCSTDYTTLFAEIRRLTGEIGRLAFVNADMLFNLQSEYLARVSVGKLAAAAGSSSTTTLGCFVRQRTSSHRLLDAACGGLMPSYLVMHPVAHHAGRRYGLEWRKGPCACADGASLLDLETGRGYVRR